MPTTPDETQRRSWAEALHEALCDRSHVDQCDWTYDDWDAPRPFGARLHYLNRAEQLMALFPDWEIADLLSIYRAVRYG